jgi:uncharacterized protein YbaR (Trm112 family)
MTHVPAAAARNTKNAMESEGLVMPIDKQLLEILCCPVTKVPVEVLPPAKLAAINEKIAQRLVKNVDGKIVETPLEEGLITEDGKTIYRVDEGIPNMLPGDGIPASGLVD